jgi:hypothetical protein
MVVGVIQRTVHMVLVRRHRTGGHRGNRQVEITQDKRQISIDWRQHESGGNQPAHEQKPEDEQSRPAWSLNVGHPFHRWPIVADLAQFHPGIGFIVAWL